MLSRILSIMLLAAATQPVLASDCPNAETAKLGFVLERQGTRAEVRPAAGQFVHVLNLYSSGKRQDVIYYGGIFPVSRFDDTARSINIPMSDLRTILPLDAKSRRALTYAPSEPGKVGSPISLEMAVTGQEKIEIGPCSYSVLIVRNKFMNGEGRVLSEHTDLYSPDLRFVLAKRYDEKGGRQSTAIYQSIKPLARQAPL